MSPLDIAENIARPIRNEPYHLLTNDCIIKSIKLKQACRELGITARVVVCIGLAKAKWFGRWLTIPVIHGWGEVQGQRIETSRPLGAPGIWGIVPVNIRPVIAVRF